MEAICKYYLEDCSYSYSIAFVFPKMGTSNQTLVEELGLPEGGEDRSANVQAGYVIQ